MLLFDGYEQSIFVPKNEHGIEESRFSMETDENNVFFDIDPIEFENMYLHGVFNAVCEKCGIPLDVYESDIIPLNKCT